MTISSSSSFSKSFGSTEIGKYGGLLEPPFSKVVSNAIISLYSYIDNIVPPMPWFHYIVTFFRLAQLLGPALFVPNSKIYKTGSTIQQSLSYISIIFHILPTAYRAAYASYIEYAFLTIAPLGLILILIAAWYYKTYAKLHTVACYAVYLYTVSLGFLLNPLQGFYIGGILTRVITGEYPANSYYICILVFSFIFIFTYIWFVKQFYCLSLLFRGCSLQTLDEYSQMVMIFTTMATTFLLASTLRLSTTDFYAVCAAAVVLYVSNIHLLFFSQSFLNSTECKLFLTTSLTAAVCTIVGMVVVPKAIKLNEITLFAIIAIFVAMYVIVSLIVKLKDKRYLALLDEFDETKEINFPHWKFAPASITGLQYGHAVFVDLTIFKAASEKWPTSHTVWVTYAKVCAIYPEYQSNLHLIEQAMVLNKVKGGAKKILSQIRSLSKTRETNLSPELKSKLSHFSKLVNKCKQRMRNIWDLILQGNTAEMENSISAAYESVTHAKQQLEHIRMQYPNNRFVARQYYRFLVEVLADQENAKVWKENVTQLQRGNPICPDVAQLLGTLSLPNFPSKVFVDQNSNFATNLEIGDTSEDMLTEVDASDDTATVIETLVNQHKVPAVTCMQVTSVIMFFICIVLPVAILIAFFMSYSTEVTDPLSNLYGVAFMRHLTAVVPAFVMRFTEEAVPDPSDPDTSYIPVVDTSMYALDSFGGHHDAKEQLKYLLTEVIDSSALLGPIRSYALGSDRMDQVRTLLFEDNIQYNYYSDSKTSRQETASCETVLSRVSVQAATMLALTEITSETIKSREKLTATTNYEATTAAFDDALSLMLDYLTEVVATNKQLYMIVAIVLSIAIFLIYIVSYIIQVYRFNLNKREVFRVLTYLPKTVISNVSASYYQLKKDNGQSSSSLDSDSEINKQEENAIKVFSSISDERNTSTAVFLYLFTNILVAACGIVAASVICINYINISKSIESGAPQIDNVLGACSSMYRGFISLLKITEEKDGFKGVLSDARVQYHVDLLITCLNNMVIFFRNANFGTEDGTKPYDQMSAAADNAETIVACDANGRAPANIIENTNCFNMRMRVFLLNALIYQRISATSLNHYPQAKGNQISSLWVVGPILMYDSLFYPVINDLLTTMTSQVNVDYNNVLIVGIVMIIVALILTIVLCVQAQNLQVLLIFTLHQLLHCPPSAVVASTKIMRLLAGNYKVDIDDTTERKSSFFAEVVNQLTDLVLVIKKEDQTIVSTNTTFDKLFNTTTEELVGKPMDEFFTPDKFQGNSSEILNQPTTLIYTDNGDKKYLLFSSAVSNNNYIIVGRDRSRQVAHQQLISDERKKSDTLLASILPPSLVPRVQAGEKEISFAVQSVSVLFLDIVSFTPWCGSHDAVYVMKTLNMIFKELDACVATHKTITKIKCIGDCYMPAAGIFDEVNNPAQHAKEMVEFGCEAINIILSIDERLNEKLQIRVGINTGGPIVAGVLGTDKPTFEILGPTINIAQQMEHHGVPMLVHISRPVYELIYGGSFQIKERGEIEVKNGKMFTYLVTPPPPTPSGD